MSQPSRRVAEGCDGLGRDARGELTAPLAANLQWDVVRDASGALLVKLLYNEKETDFKAACDNARFASASHYYRYDQLKTCYGR